MRLGYTHTTCQLEVMCINNTRGASELEILSISKSKSIRVISKTYKSHIYALCPILFIYSWRWICYSRWWIFVCGSAADLIFFMSQPRSTIITKGNDLIKSLWRSAFSLLALFLKCMIFFLRISLKHDKNSFHATGFLHGYKYSL